jgi:hypothetical protein
MKRKVNSVFSGLSNFIHNEVMVYPVFEVNID